MARPGSTSPEPGEGQPSEQEIEIIPLNRLQHICEVEVSYGVSAAPRNGTEKAAASVLGIDRQVKSTGIDRVDWHR
jgi:hypothetical protein